MTISPFPKGSRPAIRWDRSSLGACGRRSSLPLGAELKSGVEGTHFESVFPPYIVNLTLFWTKAKYITVLI